MNDEIGQAEADLPLPARLRRDIVAGDLPAGSRLKTQELARRYGTSVNPVREALHQLSGEGFVILSRNRGAKVRELDENFLRNIFDIRALIEPYLIRLFVGHATKEDIARMSAIQDEIEALDGEADSRLRDLDEAFHAITYEGHFNSEALAIRERHGQVVQALGLRYPPSPARRSAQNAEHREIIAAIEASDEAAAAEVVERHARGAERHLLEQLRRAPRG
ncbi:GntR family transcriptional regulator [Salipiger mucosus]|uniref:Putative GntR family transcriptional regulator n=1 Tax=Salipiger mucosus DSM 16094 TaxID=1123237 RepID=S9SG30_9RHOB|nr:GntR family transcriptional regulator [Salipiger mucosus]EPX85244.1 putative GntR family transcriptional regulator [Salipiger mucosus DSM 16094]